MRIEPKARSASKLQLAPVAPTGPTMAAKFTPQLQALMAHPRHDTLHIAQGVQQQTALATVSLVNASGLKVPHQPRRAPGVTLQEYGASISTALQILTDQARPKHPSSIFANLSEMLPAGALDLTQPAGKMVCLANLIAIMDTHTKQPRVPESLKKAAQAASKAVVAKCHLQTLSQAALPAAAEANKAIKEQVAAVRQAAQEHVDTMTKARFDTHLNTLFDGVLAHLENLASRASPIGLALPPAVAHAAASYLYAFFSSGQLEPALKERCANSASARRLLSCLDLNLRPAAWDMWVADTSAQDSIFGESAQCLALKTLLGPYKDTLSSPALNALKPWQFIEYSFGGTGRIIVGHKDMPGEDISAQKWVVVFIDSSHISGKPGTYEKKYAEIIRSKYPQFAHL